jgi:hypothetical protein
MGRAAELNDPGGLRGPGGLGGLGGSGGLGLLSAWRLLAIATLALAGLLPPAAAGDAQPWQGATRCRFLPPADWTQRDVRWSGACVDRLADGRGVLRAYAAGRVQRSFFGRLEAGRPVLGAVELEGGFQAGRFQDGLAVSDGERNTLIQAFDEAAAAARELASFYRRAGNAASARYYADKARQLAQQMD